VKTVCHTILSHHSSVTTLWRYTNVCIIYYYYYYYYHFTLSIKDSEGFDKNDIRTCRSDHYGGQFSRTNESKSRMLLNRCNKTEMRWNKKTVSRSSPERWLILCAKTVRKWKAVLLVLLLLLLLLLLRFQHFFVRLFAE